MKNLLILFLTIFLTSGCSLQKKTASTKTAETKTATVIETYSNKSVFEIDTTRTANFDVTYTKVEYFEARRSDTAMTPVQQIKSVETLTVRKATVSKGETVVQMSIQNDSNAQTAATVVQDIKETVKPAPDPRRWMWIFGILVICAGAFVYLKRSKVFSCIKTVLSIIRKFLKI